MADYDDFKALWADALQKQMDAYVESWKLAEHLSSVCASQPIELVPVSEIEPEHRDTLCGVRVVTLN